MKSQVVYKDQSASSNDIAQFYGAQQYLNVRYFTQIGGSSLTILKADFNRKGIPNSYVPFRNANILAIATSWVEALKYFQIKKAV